MLNGIMLSDVILYAFMPNDIMLSVVILNAFMLNVITVGFMGPKTYMLCLALHWRCRKPTNFTCHMSGLLIMPLLNFE
jgi:hypothetical protein